MVRDFWWMMSPVSRPFSIQWTLAPELEAPSCSSQNRAAARLDQLGTEVLIEAVEAICQGTEKRLAQREPTTSTRGKPPFLTEKRVRKKLAAQRRKSEPGILGQARNSIKTLALFAFVYGWAPLRNLVLSLRGKCRTTVLLFHRVDDEYLDAVSVGVEQFQKQVCMLARKYQIVDLGTFLQQRGEPRTSPAVVITFDDGYEDNHLAARLLRREGVPATFFISTRIVDSDLPFPHDQKRLKRRVPALDWNQIKEMSSWGFAVGNHTAHHVDVAALPLEEALSEIHLASEDIVEQLGDVGAERWFAYPYGRRLNMCDEVRSKLDSLGIDCCLSAYGGTNPPSFDPKNILRQGVDYNFSMLALRAAVEGWLLR